jgi:hypothetical protein
VRRTGIRRIGKSAMISSSGIYLRGKSDAKFETVFETEFIISGLVKVRK